MYTSFCRWNTWFCKDLPGCLTWCIQSLSQHNITFPLVHLHTPELRELRRKRWLHKILQEMYTVTIYSWSCFYSSFSLVFIRLRWGLGALPAVPQPMLCPLCPGRSLWSHGETGGDTWVSGRPFDPPRAGWRAAQLGAGTALKQEQGSGLLSKSKGGINCSQV